VPLAFWLRSYWALVLGTLAGRAGAVLYSYLVQPFRPRPSLHAAAEMLHFSKWLMLQNTLTFLRDRSAIFFIGRFAGSTALGAFSVSAEIANMPGTELIAPINRALLPAYASLAADLPALRREFLASMSGIALLGIPAVAGVALAAPFIVLVALGPKWSAAQPLLEVLAFFGVSQVLQSNSYSAFIALGRPGLYARMNALQVGLLLAALIVLTPTYGAIGAAWAYVLAALAALPVNFFYIARQLGLRSREFLGAVWRPLVSAAVMYASGRLWGPRLPAGAGSSVDAVVPFVSCVALGAATYTLAMLLLWLAAGRPAGAETWMLQRLRGVARI
jgi:O-antigen/teichoic acid export membrane protein